MDSSESSYSPSSGLKLPSQPSIQTPDIITLLPTSSASNFTVLYTSSSPVALRQTEITNPPLSLIEQYLYRGPPTHFSSPQKVTTIISTLAGAHTAVEYHTNVLAPLLKLLNISFTTITTASENTILEVAQAIDEDTPQTIILLSGDGGVHDFINELNTKTPITLCILPLGSGNALASSYHIGVSPLAAMLLGSARPLPIFSANVAGATVKGAVVVSWGFHASLVADADALRGKGIGVERFQVAARVGLENVHTYRGSVSVLPFDCEGEQWQSVGSRPGTDTIGHFYVLGTMVSNLEARFRISPSSIKGEPAMWVVEFPPTSGDNVKHIMEGAYQDGKHVVMTNVGYWKCRGLRLTIEEEEEKWRRICVDGTIIVVPKGSCVEVICKKSEGVNIVWWSNSM